MSNAVTAPMFALKSAHPTFCPVTDAFTGTATYHTGMETPDRQFAFDCAWAANEQNEWGDEEFFVVDVVTGEKIFETVKTCKFEDPSILF